MGLVERVRGERLPVLPNLLDKLARLLFALPLADAELGIRQTPFDELLLKLGHDVHELFTHGLTELVGFAARKSRKIARQQHDLFLINGDAVRIF